MAGKRVLLIDDDDAIRDAVGMILTCAGYSIDTARDGHEGTAKFRSFHPDIVVTDIMMPGKDGIETIRDIRRLAPQAKIIAVSGHMRGYNYSVLEMVQHLGATASLAKPFDGDQLIAAIENCLDLPSTPTAA